MQGEVMIARMIAVTAVTVTPNTSLPGTHTLLNLIGGLATVVTITALAGVLISAGVMAIGHNSSNGRLADRGRTGLVASVFAAVICGAAAALINFAVATGGKVH
jgi:hypothetical protein